MAEAARIKSLIDGSKKMSKSDPCDAGRINLLDGPDVIVSKIKKAKTDAKVGLVFDDPERPEVHNLLTLYQIASGKSREAVAAECADMGFGLFKKQLAEALITMLAPIQERYKSIMAESNQAQLKAILLNGAAQARLVSNETFIQAKQAMGFLSF
jgi:tryptophanyl-tRNA synthetase